MNDEEISTQQVLEILACTPRLEKLRIYSAYLDHRLQPPQGSRAVLHLPNLKTIELEEINGEAAGTILSFIQAPRCTLLKVGAGLEEVTEDSPARFPEPALSHFKDFQRKTIYANHNSRIRFFDGALDWESRSQSRGGSEFSLRIPCGAVAMGVEWVARIIGKGAEELVHNLEMTISHDTFTDEHFAAYHRISRCQSITRLTVQYNNPFPRRILDLLGSWQDSGDGTRPIPAFPRLEVVVLRPSQVSWLDDLEVLVNRRFGGREGAIGNQVSSLSFILETRRVPGPGPDSRMDLAQLQRLRAANGVRGITRSLNKYIPGMLAVVYDGDAEP